MPTDADPILCVVCHHDLTRYSFNERTWHVEQCLGLTQSNSPQNTGERTPIPTTKRSQSSQPKSSKFAYLDDPDWHDFKSARPLLTAQVATPLPSNNRQCLHDVDSSHDSLLSAAAHQRYEQQKLAAIYQTAAGMFSRSTTKSKQPATAKLKRTSSAPGSNRKNNEPLLGSPLTSTLQRKSSRQTKAQATQVLPTAVAKQFGAQNLWLTINHHAEQLPVVETLPIPPSRMPSIRRNYIIRIGANTDPDRWQKPSATLLCPCGYQRSLWDLATHCNPESQGDLNPAGYDHSSRSCQPYCARLHPYHCPFLLRLSTTPLDA